MLFILGALKEGQGHLVIQTAVKAKMTTVYSSWIPTIIHEKWFFFLIFFKINVVRKVKFSGPGAEDRRTRERQGHPTAELAEELQSLQIPWQALLAF